MDWKDALSQLRGDLPEAPEGTEADGEQAKAPAGGKVGGGKITVVMEKKGRKGKTATIACGFLCSDEELAEIASRARHALGTGGSSRGGEILLQGDCRDRLATFLRSEGFKV